MKPTTACRARLHITQAAHVCTIALVLATATSVLAPPARAQSIDSTVEDQVESDVTGTVEDEVQDQVESDVTGSVEDDVEDQVESDVTGAVEDEVQDQVESDVTGTVEDDVQDQVESDVTGTVEDEVEDQVESDVAGAVEDEVQGQVESDVSDAVEDEVESGVTDSVEQQIESGVVDSVAQEVASGVTDAAEARLGETIERELERTLGDAVRGRIGDDLDELVEQLSELINELGIDDVGGAIEQAAQFADEAGAGDAAAEDAGAPAAEPGSERYAAGVDAVGRAAESGVWVILVPDAHTARIDDWGFTVRERRDLDVLDRVLLRVDAPGDRDIAQAALELAIDAPGTSVDFNHAYTAEAAQAESDDTVAGAAARPETTDRTENTRSTHAAGLELGVIDSHVAAGHEALAPADIAQQDFAVFEGPRPSAHGTAVASILVGDSASVAGVLRGARVHAASVFFEDPNGNEIATTDGLVGALEWLVGRGVGVVNMSLSGPENRVLETAIDEAAARDAVVVAAVGNNGPNGEPLYPAAYDAVVGVTAVDAAHDVYRYANRGRQVTFAAPGVDVRVALSGGGYKTRSGTSMAAPHAAARIASSLDARDAPADAVLDGLKAAALDLGADGFDEIYGHGLIAALDEPADRTTLDGSPDRAASNLDGATETRR